MVTNNKIFIVFSDAFSYMLFKNLNNPLKEQLKYSKIIPGAGYSSNLHYEIFQGKNPDSVGFFTDYGIKNKNVTNNSKLGIFDKIDTFNNILRFGRKKILKKTDNIPFSEAKNFEKKGSYLFNEKSEVVAFDNIFHVIYKGCYLETFAEANLFLKSKNVDNTILIINEMDHEGHKLNNQSEEYRNLGKSILENTYNFYKNIMAIYPDSKFVFISDHGMANVYYSINITNKLNYNFGLPGENYFYYCDSLYLRLWFNDENLKKTIIEFLSNIPELIYLNENDRINYGLTNYKYGEVIYCLKKGCMFSPNNFDTNLKAQAMGLHGYLSADDDCSGVFATNFAINKSEISIREIYKTIKGALDDE